MLIIVNL